MGQVCGVGRGLRWKIKQNKSKFLALSMLGSKLFDIPSYFLVFKPYLPSWRTFFNKLNNLVIFLSGTVMSPMDFFSREIFIKWQLWHDGLENRNKWLSINTSILQKVVSALPVQCHTATPIFKWHIAYVISSWHPRFQSVSGLHYHWAMSPH